MVLLLCSAHLRYALCECAVYLGILCAGICIIQFAEKHDAYNDAHEEAPHCRPPYVLPCFRVLGFVGIKFSSTWSHFPTQDGVEETGVTVAYTVRAMDAGPILRQQPVPVDIDVTAPALLHGLFALGTELLLECLPSIWDGSALGLAVPQDESRATHAAKVWGGVCVGYSVGILWHRTYCVCTMSWQKKVRDIPPMYLFS